MMDRCGAALAILLAATAAHAQGPVVRTPPGAVEGTTTPDGRVRIFLGIPYARPPVDALRWQPPRPAPAWTGVRKATAFGARCIQGGSFDDMIFRDPGQSEDCLSLNVWAPAVRSRAKLPVMVWIHGGGFLAGGSSEPRQDGTALARKGVIVVSMNYRLGVFGFLSHPGLIAESPDRASGNYGLLDQAAALRWVSDSIAAFGGDPANVTIFGESAGSISVSAHMASPVSKALFARAIGESGGIAEWAPRMRPVTETARAGAAFAAAAGAPTLAALRARSTSEIVRSARDQKGVRFWPNVDGRFFREDPMTTYRAGRQARVPLLAGWNADEHRADQYFGALAPTAANYRAQIDADFGPDAASVLTLFPGDTPARIADSAHDLASMQFITYSTWKWIELQAASGAPVYRYRFDQPIPPEPGRRPRGTHHASDIHFVFGTLAARNLPWTSDHRRISDMIGSYWINFAKTGDPNGSGLPHWPRYEGRSRDPVMHLSVGRDTIPTARAAGDGAKFELLDRIRNSRRGTPAD